LYYSGTRDTKYLKITETYWIAKAIMGQYLEWTMEEKDSILYAIHIFEGKFELLCQSKFGIKINFFPRESVESINNKRGAHPTPWEL
jgi:hypothetical protein